MLQLTTTAAQTVQPGQAITFDSVVLQSGDGERCGGRNRRMPTIAASFRSGALEAINFSANIGALAAGAAQLIVRVDGAVLPETLMISQTAAAGNLNSVSTSTRYRGEGCSCNSNSVSVINNGSAAITVGAGATLILERRS